MLLTPPDEGPRVKGGRLKLQDVVNGEYEPAKLNGEWVSSTEFLYLDKWNQIALLSLHTLSENIVLSNTTYVSPADCLVLVYLFISPRLLRKRWHRNRSRYRPIGSTCCCPTTPARGSSTGTRRWHNIPSSTSSAVNPSN